MSLVQVTSGPFAQFTPAMTVGHARREVGEGGLAVVKAFVVEVGFPVTKLPEVDDVGGTQI